MLDVGALHELMNEPHSLPSCFSHIITVHDLVISITQPLLALDGFPNNDTKMLISRGTAKAQDPHLDSMQAFTVTALYLQEGLGDVKPTEIRDTKDILKDWDEHNIMNEQYDEAFTFPWTGHRIISPRLVPSGTIGMFGANIMHNGPRVTRPGIRVVFFNSFRMRGYRPEAEDLELQTFEYNYIIDRYPDDDDRHKASIKRYLGDWFWHIRVNENVNTKTASDADKFMKQLRSRINVMHTQIIHDIIDSKELTFIPSACYKHEHALNQYAPTLSDTLKQRIHLHNAMVAAYKCSGSSKRTVKFMHDCIEVKRIKLGET